MKKLFQYISFFLLLAISACDNSFLENTAQVYTSQQPIVLVNSSTPEVITINFEEAQNGSYKIITYPKWLKINQYAGSFQNGSAKFHVEIEPSAIYSDEEYEATLILKINTIGLVQIPIKYFNVKDIETSVDSKSIDFETMSYSSTYLHNPNQSVDLQWQVTQIPDWLSVPKKEGTIYANSNNHFPLFVARKNLPAGVYKDKVVVSIPFLSQEIVLDVTMRVAKQLISSKTIQGKVIDAKYNKTTDKLCILTASPNKLTVIKTADGSSTAFHLESSPLCMDIAYNGEKAIIGTDNKSLIYIDLASNMKETMSIGKTPFDVVLNKNYAYFSLLKEEGISQLYSIDLNSQSLSQTNFDIWTIDREMVLKIVPNTDLLVASRPNSHPSGLYLFQTNNDRINSTYNYWHEEIYPFCFSANGSKIFSGQNKVFKTPTTISTGNNSDLVLLTELPLKETYITVSALAHSNINKQFYAIYTTSNEPSFKVLDIYDDTSYKLLEQMAIPYSYLSNIKTSFKHLFINQNGSRLFVIKKQYDEDSKHTANWFIDEIKLK